MPVTREPSSSSWPFNTAPLPHRGENTGFNALGFSSSHINKIHTFHICIQWVLLREYLCSSVSTTFVLPIGLYEHLWACVFWRTFPAPRTWLPCLRRPLPLDLTAEPGGCLLPALLPPLQLHSSPMPHDYPEPSHWGALAHIHSPVSLLETIVWMSHRSVPFPLKESSLWTGGSYLFFLKNYSKITEMGGSGGQPHFRCTVCPRCLALSGISFSGLCEQRSWHPQSAFIESSPCRRNCIREWMLIGLFRPLER